MLTCKPFIKFCKRIVSQLELCYPLQIVFSASHLTFCVSSVSQICFRFDYQPRDGNIESGTGNISYLFYVFIYLFIFALYFPKSQNFIIIFRFKLYFQSQSFNLWMLGLYCPTKAKCSNYTNTKTDFYINFYISFLKSEHN